MLLHYVTYACYAAVEDYRTGSYSYDNDAVTTNLYLGNINPKVWFFVCGFASRGWVIGKNLTSAFYKTALYKRHFGKFLTRKLLQMILNVIDTM